MQDIANKYCNYRSYRSELYIQKTRPETLPNLFLLGAGKCGTTSLYKILGQHPDIHVSRIKEPTFFCTYFQDVDTPSAYVRLFNSPKKIRMDSSHAYFSNPDTAPVLKRLFPAAKFIVILREPKNRAYSLFRHMRRFKHRDGKPFEEIGDFKLALDAEDERHESADYFRNCRQYFWNFMYCRSSNFDVQLRRYFNLFDRKRFHVLTLAELSARPTETIRRILDFLDVDRNALGNMETTTFNADGLHLDFSREAGELMDQKFDGIHKRVECLVERKLDWKM